MAAKKKLKRRVKQGMKSEKFRVLEAVWFGSATVALLAPNETVKFVASIILLATCFIGTGYFIYTRTKNKKTT